jgi:hypothetical protein
LTIATEALKRGLISPKDNSVSHLRDRDYALQKDGKGLGGMQAALDKSKDNLRVALIAALLIFVFESMNGNTKAAVKNVQSALGVINNTLKCQCHLPFSKHEPFPSNLSDVVEANLLVPFIRSGRHAVALLAGNKSSRPKSDRYFGFQRYLEDYRIPSSFGTICEARRYYECIRFRIFPEHQWEKRLPDTATLPEEISAPAMLLLELFSEIALPECVPDIYIQLEQWHRAFSKVLQFPRTPDGASTYVAATTLYIQALSLKIPLHQYPNFNVVGSDHSIVAILDLGRLKQSARLPHMSGDWCSAPESCSMPRDRTRSRHQPPSKCLENAVMPSFPRLGCPELENHCSVSPLSAAVPSTIVSFR